MRSKFFFISVFATLPVVGTVAWGASFDCRPYQKARACPETVICETADLSEFDDRLADRYDYLLKSSPSGAIASLRDGQRRWLQQRESCGCDATCISNLYSSRLDELAHYVGGEASRFVSHWACADGGAVPRRFALRITEDSSIDHDGNRVLREGSIDLVAKNSSYDSERFKRGVPENFSNMRANTDCAKYGWTAENRDYIAVFCGATQGAGSVEVTSKATKEAVVHADCDSADVE